MSSVIHKLGRKSSKTRSAHAGLIFPVSRIHRHLRQGRYAKIVGRGAPVYMAGVIEYLVTEVLELAGNATVQRGKRRITPQHILLAIRNDEELNELAGSTTIPAGGVCTHP